MWAAFFVSGALCSDSRSKLPLQTCFGAGEGVGRLRILSASSALKPHGCALAFISPEWPAHQVTYVKRHCLHRATRNKCYFLLNVTKLYNRQGMIVILVFTQRKDGYAKQSKAKPKSGSQADP